MTDLRTAAQQALEALGKADKISGYANNKKVITALKAALAQQAEPPGSMPQHERLKQMEAQRQAEPVEPVAWANIDSDRLRVDPATGNVSIGAQQSEPVPGKVVAWGIFALTDGEWQLQHPVFVGDECGKENAEFERASYSGPQPLEVRPLGVVTAAAQQAEPVEPVAIADGTFNHDCPIGTLLYTAPPQRKPLMDEDILRVLMLDPPNPSLWPHLKGEAIVGDVQQAVLAIVRAVERAHGIEEKNRGR